MWQLVAGGLEVWSGLQQAEMMRQSSQLTQQINDMNARYAEIDAWEAEKQGYSKSARYQNVVNKTISDQKTALATQGLDVSSGTAKAIQEESKLNGFLNTIDIQRAASAKALGLKMEANNFRLRGYMAGLEGEMRARGMIAGSMIKGAIKAGPTISGYAKNINFSSSSGSTDSSNSEIYKGDANPSAYAGYV